MGLESAALVLAESGTETARSGSTIPGTPVVTAARREAPPCSVTLPQPSGHSWAPGPYREADQHPVLACHVAQQLSARIVDGVLARHRFTSRRARPCRLEPRGPGSDRSGLALLVGPLPCCHAAITNIS